MTAPARSHELATALRAWRDRVSPSAVGLPSGGERRVPGLRREELAALAGLSVDYLVRLEQGRAENPSPQVAESLARALRLRDEEGDALFLLSGVASPSRGDVPRSVTPGIQRMLDRLADTPAGVFTASWDPVLCNELWTALRGDVSDRPRRERNVAWRHFLASDHATHRDEEETLAFEREIASDLHRAALRYPNDRDLAALIAELVRGSARFAALWQRYELVPRTTSRKTIEHPVVGAVTLDCDVLHVPAVDLRVILYTAEPGSQDAARLELLRVAGIQSFVPAD
jgi:transcriptional regulator with XRE-family HTH domain